MTIFVLNRRNLLVAVGSVLATGLATGLATTGLATGLPVAPLPAGKACGAGADDFSALLSWTSSVASSDSPRAAAASPIGSNWKPNCTAGS